MFRQIRDLIAGSGSRIEVTTATQPVRQQSLPIDTISNSIADLFPRVLGASPLPDGMAGVGAPARLRDAVAANRSALEDALKLSQLAARESFLSLAREPLLAAARTWADSPIGDTSKDQKPLMFGGYYAPQFGGVRTRFAFWPGPRSGSPGTI